jgi:hypothetical protein
MHPRGQKNILKPETQHEIQPSCGISAIISQLLVLSSVAIVSLIWRLCTIFLSKTQTGAEESQHDELSKAVSQTKTKYFRTWPVEKTRPQGEKKEWTL